MKIFTIGFTQKSAQTFFKLIKENEIDLLLDIRLNNKSQLAGFSKGEDLKYFLKIITNTDYIYGEDYAPTKELMDGAKSGKMPRNIFEETYKGIVNDRGAVELFPENYKGYKNICLLCSEVKAEECHRGILADMLAEKYGFEVTHL